MMSAEASGPTASAERIDYLFVWSISLVAALGGLLFGYDWVVIGGAEPFYEAYFDLTSATQIGWAMSAALIGCLIGSLFSGGLSDRFGRKRMLLASAILFAGSSVLTGWASNFMLFVVWRVLGGVAIGMASNLSPIYIAEVSPSGMRGRMVSANQLTIVIGILLAQVVNWQVAQPVDPQLAEISQRQAAKKTKEDAQLLAAVESYARQLGAGLQDRDEPAAREDFVRQTQLARQAESAADKAQWQAQVFVVDGEGRTIGLGDAPDLQGDGLQRKLGASGETLLPRLTKAAKAEDSFIWTTLLKAGGDRDKQYPRMLYVQPLPGSDGWLLCGGAYQDEILVLKERLSILRDTWNGQHAWRWMFAAVAIPALLFFVLTLLVPESPRWLVKNGKDEQARRILSRIGGPAHAERELAEIQATLTSEELQHVRWRDLWEPRMRVILAVGCALAVLQQWSGINVLFNYAEKIYQQAGYGVSDILFNIVITGSVNLLFTLIAMATVDRYGRRALMLIGCAGIAGSHVLIGIAYTLGLQGPFVLGFTLAAIGCYGMSLAPVTWVLISEIFPNRIRGAAVSVAVSALWIACFILTFTFPVLKDSIGMANTFWVYAAICLAGFVFVFLKVPETKGKTLEQIEQDLVG